MSQRSQHSLVVVQQHLFASVQYLGDVRLASSCRSTGSTRWPFLYRNTALSASSILVLYASLVNTTVQLEIARRFCAAAPLRQRPVSGAVLLTH